MFHLVVPRLSIALPLNPSPQFPGGTAGPGKPAFVPYSVPRRLGTTPLNRLPGGSTAPLPPNPVAVARPAAPLAQEAVPANPPAIPETAPGLAPSPPSGSQFAALEHARAMLAEVQEIMGLLFRGGQKDGEQYQALSEQYKELSATVKTAMVELGMDVARPRTTTDLPPLEAVPAPMTADIPPITGCLGPAGRPGMASFGPQVKALQELLGSIGLTVPLTGQYDAKTFAAVREFQSRQHLAATGIVGAETRAALNALCRRGS